jgi:hypothetical protein
MVACIQPNLSSGEGCGLAAYSGHLSNWRFVLGGFITRWSFDAFGSRMQANALALAGQP